MTIQEMQWSSVQNTKMRLHFRSNRKCHEVEQAYRKNILSKVQAYEYPGGLSEFLAIKNVMVSYLPYSFSTRFALPNGPYRIGIESISTAL
jgi:hypothetical protein